jgi:TonB family protein
MSRRRSYSRFWLTAFALLISQVRLEAIQDKSPVTPNGTTTEVGKVDNTTEYYRVSVWDVKPPRVVHTVDPRYCGKNGTVVLWLVVGANGVPRNIKVTRSLDPKSDDEAVKTVQKWVFTPATKDGHPVAVLISVQVTLRADGL